MAPRVKRRFAGKPKKHKVVAVVRPALLMHIVPKARVDAENAKHWGSAVM